MNLLELMLPVVVAIVAAGPAYLSIRKTRRAIGTPNGEGPVVTMLENVLLRTGRIEAKLDTHITDDTRHAADRVLEAWQHHEGDRNAR